MVNVFGPNPLKEVIPAYWLLDANVLFSEWMRIFCATLADEVGASLFYTPLIEEEAFRNLRRLGRLSDADIAQQREKLPILLPAQIETDDASAYLPDVAFVQSKDRPIAASALGVAIKKQAPVALLTWNIKDFPRRQLARKQIIRYTPDEMALHVLQKVETSGFTLLSDSQQRFFQYLLACPRLERTSYDLKAKPWPEQLAQWSDFLKRNRLLRLNKSLF